MSKEPPSPNDEPDADASAAMPPSPERRAYSPPRMHHYGTVVDLTLGGNPLEKNDPGGPSSGKLV